MEMEIDTFSAIAQKSWNNFLQMLPSIAFAILIFTIGIFIIRWLSGLVSRAISRRSANPLVSDFLVNIASFLLYILLTILCLSILGWGNITNKILAGAGITTFIIGFALKDIGENFLAGILMAFRRPFRVGDLIELDKVKGRVIRMTLRETRVKTLDGKDVFVPNGMILKMPLYNHTIDNHLRGEFLIGLDYDEDIAAAIKLIEETVNNFTRVGDIPPAQVLISDFSASTVNLKVHFWFETRNVKAPGIQLKSDLMLRVLQVLTKAGYKMPAKIVELKMHENTKGISSSASS